MASKADVKAALEVVEVKLGELKVAVDALEENNVEELQKKILELEAKVAEQAAVLAQANTMAKAIDEAITD